MPVIGVLGSDSAELATARIKAWHQGLTETGYFEGRNVAIEYRLANGQYERLGVLAADLARDQVTVIAVIGSVKAALAAHSATAAVPIVFVTGRRPGRADRFDILLVKLWQLRDFELQGFCRHVASPQFPLFNHNGS